MPHKNKVTFYDHLLWYLIADKNQLEDQKYPVIEFPTIDKRTSRVLENLFFLQWKLYSIQIKLTIQEKKNNIKIWETWISNLTYYPGLMNIQRIPAKHSRLCIFFSSNFPPQTHSLFAGQTSLMHEHISSSQLMLREGPSQYQGCPSQQGD